MVKIFTVKIRTPFFLVRVFPCLLLLGCLFLFNGCWDRQEVESLALVQVLGIDKGPGGKGLTITFMIAIPPKIAGGDSGNPAGGGGGGSDTGTFIVSMDSPTIYEGFNLINTTVNRDITLLQNSAIIFSEDLAKKGLRKWIDNLARFRQIRRTNLIFICKGKAADVMNIKPRLEKNPSEYFIDLAIESRRTGMFPYVTLHDFLNAYEAYAQESFAPYLAKYKRKEPGAEEAAGGVGAGAGKPGQGSPSGQGAKPEAKTENVRIEGTAVFKRDKMAGTLDLYESQVLQLLTNQFREAILTVPDPRKKDYKVVIRLMGSKPAKVKYLPRKGEHFFKVDLRLEADLVSIQSGIDYTEPNLELVLAKHIARILKKRITKVISKVQQQYDSDVFGFGTQVRKKFLTTKEWHDYYWPDKFKDARFQIGVKVAIRRVGVQFHPPAIR
ncbi:MAG: Ger(x)C family spore germination protein [Bacillota bacterium]